MLFRSVESAITTFFDPSNWDIGRPLYISNIVELVESIDGVSYVDIFSPKDNILPTGKLADPTEEGLGYNQMIVEGTRKTSYFYEKTPAPAGIRAGV